jgi:hypothetical protein
VSFFGIPNLNNLLQPLETVAKIAGSVNGIQRWGSVRQDIIMQLNRAQVYARVHPDKFTGLGDQT